METRRNREALERMTPEQRAAVERIRARRTTPEHRAEMEAAREQIRKEFPPATTADDDLAELVAALKAERERRGLSLTDMAERTRLDRAMVSKLENAHLHNPTWNTLRAYARALGLRLALHAEPIGAAEPGKP